MGADGLGTVLREPTGRRTVLRGADGRRPVLRGVVGWSRADQPKTVRIAATCTTGGNVGMTVGASGGPPRSGGAALAFWPCKHVRFP